MAKLSFRFASLSTAALLFLTTVRVASAGDPIIFSSGQNQKRSQPAPAQLANVRVETALERLSSPRPFENTGEATPLPARPSKRRGLSRKDKEKAEDKQDWMGLDKDELRDRAEDGSFMELDEGDLDEKEAPSEILEGADERRPGRGTQQEMETTEKRVPAHILSPTQRQAREKKAASRETRSVEQTETDEAALTESAVNPNALKEMDLKKFLSPVEANGTAAEGVSLRSFLGGDRLPPAAAEPRNNSFNALLNQSFPGTVSPSDDFGSTLRGGETLQRSSATSLAPSPSSLRPSGNDNGLTAREMPGRPLSVPEMPKLAPSRAERISRAPGVRPGDEVRKMFESPGIDTETMRKARGR